MPTETHSQFGRRLIRTALIGPLLFTTCTAIVNLPGGQVEVTGRAFIFDGDTLTFTVPSGDVAPAEEAAPSAPSDTTSDP